MFEFRGIVNSKNGHELSGYCHIGHGHLFFLGHFDDRPLMPAAVQIQMLSLFILTYKRWNVKIHGGQNIKFLQPVIPGDVVGLTIARSADTKAQFTITRHGAGLASKGLLVLSRDDFG